MEKQSSNSNASKAKPLRPKVFGSDKLQINEDDASRLIGSIIEKGLSDEVQNKPFWFTPAPKPSVLPFPVARHRSHGPHWGPIGSKKGEADDNDEDVDEEEDHDESENNSIANFANPVQRKQKKGLNFSRWREVISSDSTSLMDKVEEKKLRFGRAEEGRKDVKPIGIADKKIMSNSSKTTENRHAPMNIDIEPNSNLCASLTKSRETVKTDQAVGFSSSVADMELDNYDQLCINENVNSANSVNSNGDLRFNSVKSQSNVKTPFYSDAGNMQGSTSLESEIDAENCARLQKMSADEIAEAQSEIMEKLDPKLLGLLKRRGQEKLRKQKGSGCNMETNGESNTTTGQEQSVKDAKPSWHFESNISSTANLATSEVAQRQVDNIVAPTLGVSSGSLWNAWSERVEAVRQLRFSLDGTVITNDFVQIPDTDGVSDENRHTAGNVTDRDFLRTEGDPGAAGYTIKEAVELTRSVIPGQRVFGLHLLASVLDKALHNISKNPVGCTVTNDYKAEECVDSEAIWAFALGPEPELVLSLRMCLDDNRDSVVLACAKIIRCILSCELNENFFDILERVPFGGRHVCTAPVFRSKPEIDGGFLRGGFWKYNAKPSNILPFDGKTTNSGTEGKHTIQDDIVLAGQDFAAGLVRMGILPRFRYLLETNPSAPLEECIISVLIAIARHSPTCADAIMKLPRLVERVVSRFTTNNILEVHPSQIKSVCLMKVLARYEKENCMEFIKNGVFQAMTLHLYQNSSSLETWLKLGKEKCKLLSALMVEQLRFWKVCIECGCCISYFSVIFPALCLWLNPPALEKLVQSNLLNEFALVSTETYLVMEALARTLPNLYSQTLLSNQIPEYAGNDIETWSWSYVGPMIDLALKWISLRSNLFKWQNGNQKDFVLKDTSVNSFLWVYSAIMHMLSRVLERVIPEETASLRESSSHVPWLPEFVPKIGLEIIRNRFLSFSGGADMESEDDLTEGSSFVRELCCLRQRGDSETSLASVCCLHGLVQVVVSMDKLISLAKADISNPPQGYSSSREGNILASGSLKGSLVELRSVLIIFMKFIATEWKFVQSIETFGRGGPAPGVGLGWGASGGGFWSLAVLLAQTDARFLIHLLKVFQTKTVIELPTNEGMTFSMEMINSTLEACLILGPRDRFLMEKALDIVLQVPVLKYLGLQIKHRIKLTSWEYKEDDYLNFSTILASHFRNRWLCGKKKSKVTDNNGLSGNKASKKGVGSLETIHEHMDTTNMTNSDQYCSSLVVEWAHQRLPLHTHWFLSPISTICNSQNIGRRKGYNTFDLELDLEILEIIKGGLFLLLGIEVMSASLSTDVLSPVQSVPLIWKLHSLSMVLLTGMAVLEDERSRDVYESLQELYGQLLDKARYKNSGEISAEFLRFQSEIHESYLTFIETLVEQYAAISYGDWIFGRQVGVYLHRCVESPMRLACWNALSNARVLELLPPLQNCFAEPEGYLEPVEDNENILEAYVKSWISGALDRAVTRGSMAFTLVLHHLSSFIFLHNDTDKLPLRNKLAKSLLLDSSRKQQHEKMMLDFVRYNKQCTFQMPDQRGRRSTIQKSDIEKRFEVLRDVCEGDSSVLSQVEKLKSIIFKDYL